MKSARIINKILLFLLTLTLIISSITVSADVVTMTSEFNGLNEVPVDASIPLVFNEEVTAEDITVTADGQAEKRYSLKGSEGNYILSFSKPMKQCAKYVISCGDSSVSYTTANNTGVASMRPSLENTAEKNEVLENYADSLTLFITWEEENKSALFETPKMINLSDSDNPQQRSLNIIFGSANASNQIGIQWSYYKDLNAGTNIGPDNIINNLDISDITGFSLTVRDYVIYLYAQKGEGNYTYLAKKDVTAYRNGYIKNTAAWSPNYVSLSTVYFKVDIGDGSYVEKVESYDLTSIFNGCTAVPLNTKIPFELSEERVLFPEDVSVKCGDTIITGKTLSGSGKNYAVEFAMEENQTYSITVGDGTPVTFSTALKTGKYIISPTDAANKNLLLPASFDDITLKITSKGTVENKGITLSANGEKPKLTFRITNDGVMGSIWEFFDTNAELENPNVSMGPASLISSLGINDTLYLTIMDYVVYPYKVSASGVCTPLEPYDIGSAGNASKGWKGYIRNNAIKFNNIYVDSINLTVEAGIGSTGEKEPEAVSLDDFVADSSDNMIVYPHFGTPVFVEPGKDFSVEITSPYENLSSSGWVVYAENEYKSWLCKVNSAEYSENSVYLGTKNGYVLNVSLPEDISPELMNLVVKHKSDGSIKYLSPQSVSIVPELNSDFYAMAVSDTHINSWKKEYTTVQEGRNFETMNKALELAGARYVYHGGDIGAYASYDKLTAVKDVFIDAFTTSKVPFIAVAGNHEFDTYSYPSGTAIRDSSLTLMNWDEVTSDTDLSDKQIVSNFTFDTFDRAYGMRSALIPMGDSMVIAKHDYGAYKSFTGNGKESELSEPFVLRNALSDKWQSWNNGNENAYRIVYQHTWNTGSESTDLTNNTQSPTYGAAAFMSPTYHPESESMIPYDFQAVGHYHSLYAVNEKLLCFGGSGHDECDWAGEGILLDFDYDSSYDKKWKLNLTDTMSGDPYLGSQYIAKNMTKEEIEERNEYIDDIYQTDFIIDGYLEQPALYSSFYYPNNGTADYNIAKITNKLDFNFHDGRIKFVMKKGGYAVENAELISQYDSYDGFYTIVLAKVNIEPGSENEPSEIAVLCSPEESSGNISYNIEGAETGFVSAGTKYLDVISTSDVSGATLTKDNVVVTKNGKTTDYELSFPNSRTLRINFPGGLSAQSKYIVNVDSSEFTFVVLPEKYTENEYYSKGSLTGSSRPLSFENMPYDNFVMDVTIKNTTPGNNERTPDSKFTYGNVTLELHPKVDGTSYNYRFFNYNSWNDTQFRKWHMIASKTPSGNQIGDGLIEQRGVADVTSLLSTNPLKRFEDEESYDFRIIKTGKKLSLYSKNTKDKSYDRLFEYYDTGAPVGKEHFYLPEDAAYAIIKLSANGITNTAAKGLKLYEIIDEAEVINTQFEETDLGYNITADIDCSYIDLSEISVGKAICATYNNGVLADMDIKDLKGGSNAVTFKTLKKGDACKLFVIDSSKRFKPLIKNVELYKTGKN